VKTDKLIDTLENSENSEVRSRIFTLEGDNVEDQPLFPHQMETMRNIYQHNNRSGIVRYPTGGGKTRLAIGYMSKEMKRVDNRKFLWGSYPKKVIRQSMLRLAELAGEFDDDTKFAWYGSDMKRNRELLEQVDILFIMRDQFSRLMEHGKDGRVIKNPLVRLYDEKQDEDKLHSTLIYDECHQMGAKKLQNEWKEFTRSRSCSIHTIGLSATPIPTSVSKTRMLCKTIFPIDGNVRGERPEWNMLCHHDVSFKYLQEQNVLCDINKQWEDREDFDIAVKCPDTRPLPNDPTKKEMNEFVKQFNKHRMSSPGVVSNLAEDVAENIEELGKTLMFVPTIQCANRLMSEMTEKDELKGRVSMVHSSLSEFNEDSDVDVADRNRHVQAFKERGSDPCVMINVGMLTTGFDDPKIKSVILGRLTMSNNLFWQMIGRGLRGAAVNGTVDCNVIDPIKLTEKYEVFDGYRASIEDKQEEFRKILESSPDEPEKDSKIITTTRTRKSARVQREKLSSESKRSVAMALNEFVEYETFRKAVQCEESGMTALEWCYQLIDQAEEEMDANLTWMKTTSFTPESDQEVDLKHFHRKVEVCKEKGITSRKDWMKHVTQSI
jgi:superfamily II DNA or RNA helicase